MRIGVSERSGYAVADVRVGARWMVERVRAARDAGLESLFLGEHHSTGGAYYQNVPMPVSYTHLTLPTIYSV